MGDELETTSQVATADAPLPAGPPQAGQPVASAEGQAQPGDKGPEAPIAAATKTEEKKPRVYTEAEVTAIRAEQDRERNQLREEVARTKLIEMQRKAEAEEQAADARLQQAVQNGLLSEQEAATGKGLRKELRTMDQIYQHVLPRVDVGVRIATVLNLVDGVAKRDGLSEYEKGRMFDSLMREKDVNDPAEYRVRLLSRQEEKYKEEARLARLKTESHDRGPGTSAAGQDTAEKRLSNRFPNSPELT